MLSASTAAGYGETLVTGPASRALARRVAGVSASYHRAGAERIRGVPGVAPRASTAGFRGVAPRVNTVPFDGQAYAG